MLSQKIERIIMKKIQISLFVMMLGTSLHAQDKICCLLNNKIIAYNIDSTDSEFFRVTMETDSGSSTILNIPSRYYRESDSIVVKIRKKELLDGNNSIQASYCYSVGPHDIALYLNPDLFSVSPERGDGLLYSIELFYQDEKMWDKRQMSNSRE